MIFDSIENLRAYEGLGRSFQTAAAYIREHDLSVLPVGRVEIDGERVFALVSERTMTETPACWEVHRKYADLQVALEGRERIGYTAERIEGLRFDEEHDCALTEDARGAYADLTPGTFLIFLPNEPHKPGCPARAGDYSKKCVFKCLI